MPGCVAYVQIPNFRRCLGAIILTGRRAEDVARISLRVNGLELVDFPTSRAEDGETISGGKMAQIVAGLLGPVTHKGIVIALGNEQGSGPDLSSGCFELRIEIAQTASLTGKLSCFAKLTV